MFTAAIHSRSPSRERAGTPPACVTSALSPSATLELLNEKVHTLIVGQLLHVSIDNLLKFVGNGNVVLGKSTVILNRAVASASCYAINSRN